MVNYWLFQVMYDAIPETWQTFVRTRIAAQHYPPGWTLEGPNLKSIMSMKQGDKVIAAFTKHRFAGYGELMSDFYRDGAPLRIKSNTGETYSFQERFDCDWTVIPLDKTPLFLNCHELKSAGYAIDLEHGRAIRQIDKRTYLALKKKLDEEGARRHQGIWMVKARKVLKSGKAGWHWRQYFQNEDTTHHNWGGPDWVRSTYSMKLLKTQVQVGDLVVAYQMDHETNQRAILGFTRMASGGKEYERGSGQFNCFDLPSPEEALWLDPPLRIEDLYLARCYPKCLASGSQGTLFPVSEDEFEGIVKAIASFSHGMNQDLLPWLKDAGWESSLPNSDLLTAEPRHGDRDDRCSPEDVDSNLDKWERRFAKRSDLYIRNQIRSWIRHDRPLIRALKDKYGFRCQYPNCAASIPIKKGGAYCEVAHILGVSRGGTVVRTNLIVLCPNHHKMFDYGDLTIDKNNRQRITGTLNDEPFEIIR